MQYRVIRGKTAESERDNHEEESLRRWWEKTYPCLCIDILAKYFINLYIVFHTLQLYYLCGFSLPSLRIASSCLAAHALMFANRNGLHNCA